MISALEYCHDRANIIHRDIKPDNILVDENNRAKLADFGISFIMENGSDEITTDAGSNYFLSPEATRGSHFKGRQSDVWACGVTLYNMISRDFPFKGLYCPDLYKNIQNQPLKLTSMMKGDLGHLLERLLDK